MVQSKILLKFKNIQHFFLNSSDSLNLEKFIPNREGLIQCEQIHGNRVKIIDKKTAKFLIGYDGVISHNNLYLAVRTADCLPILFYQPDNNTIACIHAGWKGLVSGIVERCIKLLKKSTQLIDNTVSVVGPHIGICCYDIPYDRLQVFQKKGYITDKYIKFLNNKYFIDLGKIAHDKLIKLGLKEENIDIMDICTSCSKEYYSYRRQGKNASRMYNIIGKLV